MFTQLSLEEINPCIRAVGLEEISPSLGHKRKIYDYEFIYCHKGSFKILYDHYHVTGFQGDILINPPNQTHQLDYSHAVEVYWVHFDFIHLKGQDDISRYISRSKQIALSKDTFASHKARNPIMIKPNLILPATYSVADPLATYSHFLALMDLFDRKPFHWVVRTKIIMLELLEDTFKHLKPHERKLGSLLVSSVLDYINENNHRRITASELSNRFHYHKDTLNRLVKKETGLTLRDHIKTSRSEKALSLIQSTDLSLDEISYLCGFTDRSHLIKTFKDQYQHSPGFYRLPD